MIGDSRLLCEGEREREREGQYLTKALDNYCQVTFKLKIIEKKKHAHGKRF